MKKFWLKISSEALTDPTLLNDYKAIQTRIDKKPEADNQYWHVHVFQFNAEELAEFAAKLNEGMKEGWYAIAFNETEVSVILKSKTFILEREAVWDSDAYREMQEYAAAHGVQREYLDFNERFEEYTSWSKELERGPVQSLHHAAITVNKIDKVAAWYQSHFGLIITDQYKKNGRSRYFLEKGSVKIELFNYGEQTKPLPEERKELDSELRVCGIKHFCFAVEDVAEECERLRSAGVTIAQEIDSAGYGGSFFFVADPEGNLIELWSNT